MGLLMLIDDIGLLISTFGVLFVYGMTVETLSRNVWIICLFFAGIKILLTGIADITGIGRRLWVSIIFTALADGVIILINRFMSFGLSNYLLLYTTAADIVVITIAFFIWKKIAGKDIEKAEQRREWISSDNPDENVLEGISDRSQAEAVPDQSEKTEAEPVKAAVETAPKAETAEFDADAFESLFIDDTDEIPSADAQAVEAVFSEEPAQTQEPEYAGESLSFDEITAPIPVIDDYDLTGTASEKTAPEEVLQAETEPEAVPDDAEDLFSQITAPIPLIDDEMIRASETAGRTASVQAPDAVEEKAAAEAQKAYTQTEDQLCRELDSLLSRVTETAQRSKILEENVTSFSQEVDNMPALTNEEDIVESGRLIRSKLRTIIDKQFVMDDVMNEVIKTSERVNKRIEKLNKIEAQLKERERRLEQREAGMQSSLFEDLTAPINKISETDVIRSVDSSAKKLEKRRSSGALKPNEVVVQTGGYEIIIDEKDLDAVKAYLAAQQ